MAERGRRRSFDKDAALARAMELFWAKGYEGASISDLTRAMGIAAPSLYAAFGSKEALFRQALELYAETEGPEIWGAVDSAPTAFQAVEGFLMETARVFARPGKPPGCLVVLSALHATETCETVRRELVGLRAQSVRDLADRIKEGIAAGELPEGTDAEALASFYVTVQQGMSVQARDGADEPRLRAIAHAALAAWPGSSVQPAGAVSH